MRNLISFILLIAVSSHGAYTEFYCQTTGSNLNAGSTTADAALVTATSGNWVAGTGVFTAAGANLSALSVGMWASVYNDGATVGVFVGRITAFDDTADTITVSLTAKSGTAPTDGTGNRSIKVGGAWKGPNAAENFPFNFVAATMTDASSNVPRINFKSGTTYAVTAAITHSVVGPIRWQGYTTTAGDGGRATIDGGTTGASYTVLTVSGVNNDLEDFIIANNGATGSANLVAVTANEVLMRGCVFHDSRGHGLSATGTSTIISCEAYACNTSNGSALGGFSTAGNGNYLINCISHDNTAGSNAHGYAISGLTFMLGCIADSNTGMGVRFSGTISALHMESCDVYNNTLSGVDMTGATANLVVIRNSNFIKNGAWGITSSGSSVRNGEIVNCGFGAGTQVNTSGSIDTNIGGIRTAGTITYANDVTPWSDPANGNFTVSLAAAKNTGSRVYVQTAASYAGTVAYPDVGGAQHLSSAGSSASSYTFAQ